MRKTDIPLDVDAAVFDGRLERLHHSHVITTTLPHGGVGLLARLAKRAGLRFDFGGSDKPDDLAALTRALTGRGLGSTRGSCE
ncbi:hypothetical protein SMC26_34055 [Actinomadura fulvescens]|uniref:Uncharacterized protein n=1 Tax=Actinomadura fulvescens TaxID=46160 RepID=A0ABN3PNR3_9ACTN